MVDLQNLFLQIYLMTAGPGTLPYTVPFRLIRQSRVTVPCGPALILVHVTRHFDFGRMRKMVQKKKL